MKRVKTLALAAPPRFRIASRTRRMWGASMSSPIIFSAKYAFTLQLMSKGPSCTRDQPPCLPCVRRR